MKCNKTLVKAGMSGVLMLAGMSVAQAVTTTYTVTSTNSDTGAASCDGTTCPTLRSALTAANALPASQGDNIVVEFAPDVSGVISYSNSAQRMRTDAFGPAAHSGSSGAVFSIEAAQPLRLDFGSRVSVTNVDDDLTAIILYVSSDDVVIENFNAPDGPGIRGAGSAITVEAANLTIRNGVSDGLIQAYRVQDRCLVLLDGTSRFSLQNFQCNNPRNAGLQIEGQGTVSDINLTGVGFENAGASDVETSAEIVIESGSAANPTTVNGMQITDSQFTTDGSISARSIYLRSNAVISDFSISNSSFSGALTQGVFVADGDGGATLIDGLEITDNRFEGTGVMIRFPDNAASDQAGIIIEGNVMNGSRCANAPCGLVTLYGGSFTDTRIANNQFLNQVDVDGGSSTIMIGAAGSSNVVDGNLIDGDETNSAAKDLDAILSLAANPGASTGWVISNNSIRNMLGNGGRGPIFLNGDGYTELVGNTFGVNSRAAATGDAAPEDGSNWFAVNNHVGANDRIQTWRPRYASATESALIVGVDPVASPLGSNTPAAEPVFIDVFYSTSDVAEIYLGRIPGSHSTSRAVGHFAPVDPVGSVRVQITDANGRSSQYSASVAVVPPVDVETGGGSLGLWVLLPLGFVALRRRSCAVLAGLLGVGMTGQALANDMPWHERIYAGAQVGALSTDFDLKGLNRALVNEGAVVERLNDESETLGYGLWLGYGLTRNLGLELSYTTGAEEKVRFISEENLDVERALDIAKPYLSGYGDSYLLRLRYFHEFNQDWFATPHLGLGLTQTDQSLRAGDQAESLNEETFTWALGGGVHYRFMRDWSAGVAVDYYQGDSDNAYTLISAVVQWRFPQALPQPAAQAPSSPPVEVVPAVKQAAPAALAEPVRPDLDGISLHGVGFKSGGSQLTAQARDILNANYPALDQALQQSPSLFVEIAGHTDSTGNAQLNQDLSQARAQSVRDYLVGLGLDSYRLTAVGYGSSQPVASNETAQGRAINRRVELRVAN